MNDKQKGRHFVTISARKADDLRKLQAFGLDVFAPTARMTAVSAADARKRGAAAPKPFVVEGLLDRSEIDKLRVAGYDVSIDAAMSERSVKPGDTLEIDTWLSSVNEKVAKDAKVK